MLAAFFGSNRAGLARRFFLLVLFRFWLMSSFTPLIGVAGLSFIPLPWAFFLMYGNNGLLDFLLVAGQLYTLWRLVKTLRKTASDSEPSNLPRISDTWQVILFGTETRVQPLLNALLIATAMRAVWLAINVDDPSGMILLWAFIPWPWSMYSTIVWVIEVLFVLYQLRTALMVVRLLLLERAQISQRSSASQNTLLTTLSIRRPVTAPGYRQPSSSAPALF